MRETADNEFAELLPLVSKTDERTKFVLEMSVHRLILTSLAVEIGVSLCVPCLLV